MNPLKSVPQNELASEKATLRRPISSSQPRCPLPVANSTKSFWIDTPGANPLAKHGSQGQLTTDADICIIGSGITGISAAYHLSQLNKNLNVVVLEARDFCSGATGRNGGHLTPSTFLEFSKREKEINTKGAVAALAIEHRTVYSIVDLLNKHGLAGAVDLAAGGHKEILFTPEEVKTVKADLAAAKKAGIDVSQVSWIEQEEMKKKYGAEYPGVQIPGFNLWPLKLVTQLFYLAKRDLSSLTLHTSTPVNSVNPLSGSNRRFSLVTPRGNVQCSTVLYATNGYSSHLLPQMHGPKGIVPTRGQVIAVRAATPMEQGGWYGNEGFEYWFPRPVQDSSECPLVILGGGREAAKAGRYGLYVTDDSKMDPTTSKALREFLPEVFPSMYEKGREPEMEWSGIMGFTEAGDPFVGPLGKGQFIAAGYGGHGMPRAYACAEAIAQMIVAERDGMEWIQPDWFPEWFHTSKRLEQNESDVKGGVHPPFSAWEGIEIERLHEVAARLKV